MKKKMRLVFAFVLVIISGFLLINSRYIVALAKSVYLEDVEVNKIYNKGDELNFFDDDGYNFINRLYVAYFDSEDKLLDLHLINTSISSGNYIESYFIGDSCVDTNNKYSNYSGYLDYRCQNSETSHLNYVVDEEKLHSVEHWKLTVDPERNIVDYCEEYSIDLPLCNDLIENQGYSSNYLVGLPLLVFKEYQKPVFNMICDSEVVKYGEKVNCKLSVNSTDQLESFKTSLDNEHFDISDIQVAEGWEYEKDEDGSYVFIKDNDTTEGLDVLNFSVSPKGKTALETSVIASDFSFTTSFGLEEELNVSTKLNIEAEKVDNPNTYDNKIHILIGLLLIASGIFVVLYNNKSKNIFE